MLDISTVGAEHRLGIDFADVYDSSELAKRNDVLVEELSVPKPGIEPLFFDREYAADMWTQFKMLMYRCFVSYWRNPQYNAVKFVFCTVLGVLLGTIYLNLGQER